MNIHIYDAIILFFIYSLIGWIWESIYCAIKRAHWENRGFLFGPICPIYGVGGMLITVIYLAFERFGDLELNSFQIFLAAFIGSMPLEYLTSWGLEKIFHASWWDYHDMKFNLNGRICLPASIGFGIGGLLMVNFLLPNVIKLIGSVNYIVLEIVSYVLIALFAADMTLTIQALTGLEARIKAVEDNWDAQMETVVASFETRKENVEETFAQLKEQSAERRSQNLVSNMGYLQRHALKRVKTFKPIRNKEVFSSIHTALQNYNRADHRRKRKEA